MNIGAFFDIDGTLYRDSLMIEHFKKLLKYEVLDPVLWYGHVEKTFKKWQKRRGNYEDYMEELADIYVNAIKNLNKYDTAFITKQVIDLKGDAVYQFTRERIEYHHKMGHHVFFISGSPDYLVEAMAEKYHATECKGTTYLVDDQGNFTGKVIRMWDANSKAVAIAELTSKYNLNLQESYAYGDTNGDYSMLTSVGHGYAINPTKELLHRLKDVSSVKIIVERKDVIYSLDPNVATLEDHTD
ncbi:MAG: HAD-IB family hydrolase [Clostridia bacterium]|nr:HAD-IB family hydrolase [Clostridia bacterium]